VKRLDKWAHKRLPIRFFINVYIRIYIESFFGIVITALNEIFEDTNLEEYEYCISFAFAIFLISLYGIVLLIVFTIFYP